MADLPLSDSGNGCKSMDRDFCGGGWLVSSFGGTSAIRIHPSTFAVLILVLSFLGP